MFHDQLIPFRIQTKLADKIIELAEEKPEHFDSTSHVIRVAVIELLRKHKKIPQQENIKSYKIK